MWQWESAGDLPLICCWCLGAKEEWINWQKCWCSPNGAGPNGGRSIIVRTCAPVMGRPSRQTHVTLMLQSKATSYKRGSASRSDEGFYWFFICQECRRDTRKLDPWDTVTVAKKEIRYENSAWQPTFVDEDKSWLEEVKRNGEDWYGRGAYWSPPPSDPPSPRSEIPVEDPWCQDSRPHDVGNQLPIPPSGATLSPSSASSSWQLPTSASHIPIGTTWMGPTPGVTLTANPQDPHTIMTGNQIAPALQGRPVQLGSGFIVPQNANQPRSLQDWGFVYFDLILANMTEQDWVTINYDPWQDPSANNFSSPIMAEWTQRLFTMIRLNRAGALRNERPP